MSIAIFQTDDGRVPGLEYLPCGEIVPKVGMALKTDGGKLAPASGTERPAYLSMTERDAACADGELIPVIRISGDTVFETGTPDGFTAVLGDRVQLSADSLGLTGETGGAAEVVYTDSEITRFRFVQADGATAASE